MVKITSIHMVGTDHHQHISEMKWINPGTGATGASSREAMVSFVHDNPGQAYVQGPTAQAFLQVRDATPPYVQTVADNTWTDNLLSLPRY
jgi:hypothetical protein